MQRNPWWVVPVLTSGVNSQVGMQTGGKTRVFPVRKSGCALLFSSYLESDSVRQMAAGKI